MSIEPAPAIPAGAAFFLTFVTFVHIETELRDVLIAATRVILASAMGNRDLSATFELKPYCRRRRKPHGHPQAFTDEPRRRCGSSPRVLDRRDVRSALGGLRPSELR